MIKSIIIDISVVLGLLIGVPFLFIYILAGINRQSKALLVRRFGVRSQVLFGCLGIVVHELSHLIIAVIFAHQIVSVRLIKFPKDTDPSLGYVNHRWNPHNLYQSVGNLFIGVAPVFGSCAVIALLAKLLIPNAYQWLQTIAQNPQLIASLPLPSINWLSSLFFLLLTANICIGGFELSAADYHNALQGLFKTIVVIVFITLLLLFMPFQAAVFSAGIQLIKIMGLILTGNVIVSLIVNGLLRFL
ncbi:hypothetical protein FEZ41_05835 [Lentilactobacillus parafarraginis]|jgi:hypothetical protein|uniref:Uncharacterized protein n=2 Tax=Lentilactobacillus parafarraginis TaxID=390842 RepID=A0A0R1YJ31_9LACO|nr:hypothetical protein [Lentilactobacillus parafarraginis]KRM41893.1 hypothetical protein FD47_GL002037 [Lentilactobacillus parafarraginis DSM 18390 = JCM 14109]TLQ19768.1 hypothetical protein FEZ41_05835 [Lentilactobacillus parafarraginis]